MKILFVDDEKMILNGIRRSLHGTGWDIKCAVGGQEALELLETQEVDVIVSDMRMPRMEGDELLNKVHTLYPGIVRIVLSGYADQEASLRASLVAHQWIDKPCDKEKLIGILKNIEVVINHLLTSDIQLAVGKVNALPSPPNTFVRIKALVESGGGDVGKIATVIEEDPSLTAKVLQLTNSSFFCRGTPVDDVSQAVVRLGFDLISNIVLLSETYSKIPETKLLDANKEQLNSLSLSKLAAQLVEPEQQKTASLAGLLHNIGKFVLIQTFPETAADYVKKCTADSDILSLEQELFNTDYTELGAYLLFLWGFPKEVIEAVLNHQRPKKLIENKYSVGCAVYIAASLLRDEIISPTFITHFQLEEKIPTWASIAQKLKE